MTRTQQRHDEGEDQDNENDKDGADNEADEISCFTNDPKHRVSVTVGNKVFTLSTTRATHPANRRTLWAHVNRQYRGGGLYDIDATEDKEDAEDGGKRKPRTKKTTWMVIS